ncbi:MAG: hypothetical protein ACRDWT_02550 [Jatrophihabitantaceae bacterium]
MVGLVVVFVVVLVIGVAVAMDRSARRHNWKRRSSMQMIAGRRDLRDNLHSTPGHGNSD